MGEGKEKHQDKTEEEYWTWSKNYKNWYHIHEDGRCEWAKGKERGKG